MFDLIAAMRTCTGSVVVVVVDVVDVVDVGNADDVDVEDSSVEDVVPG